ncbi:MAG: NupC/NupG family nucleoside CNT transporter, partial [Bacteroidetes bacterium]|nr:NupC/NupG family nucleoside CNT transporter [Bacteroidota bacterium]
MDIISVLRGIGGVGFIILIAYLFSNNKKQVNWSLVAKAFGIQLTFAIFIIHSITLRSWFWPLGLLKDVIDGIGAGVVALLNYTLVGAQFVFGNLAVNSGESSLGFFFAFQVLPTIIFV